MFEDKDGHLASYQRNAQMSISEARSFLTEVEQKIKNAQE